MDYMFYDDRIYDCVLCRRCTHWYNGLCESCIYNIDEFIYSFGGDEGLGDDEFYHVEEKYIEMDYNIVSQRKRAYTI
jgi:hypothetical protein